MKNTLKSVVLAFLFIVASHSCTNDEGITINSSNKINLKINFSGLHIETSNLSGKLTKNGSFQEISDWIHIFETNLAIEFTNIATSTVFTLPYNPANPDAEYSIILPFGNYEYKLESTGDIYSNYIPFIAQGTIEIDENDVILELVGITDYGLVTVDMFHTTSAIIEDSQLGTIELATLQDHYYKYVKQGQQPLVQISEDVLNTEPSYQLPSIGALVRYNLLLNINELNVISFILSDFEQEDIYFEIDPNAARTYVPDNNFEQALIDLGYDDVLDDYVFTSNISNLRTINLFEKNISDATGIEDFIELESLIIDNNNLITINISNNTKLLNFEASYNQLTSINLSNNLNLIKLVLSFNSISEIDLNNNQNLEQLYCNSNQLQNLNIETNTKLNNINCQNNQIQELNVSENKNLVYLDCNNNNLITSLDVTNSPLLTNIYLQGNQISEIDISLNIELLEFYCFNTNLSALNVSNNTKLDNFLCNANPQLNCIQVNQNQYDNIPSNWVKDTDANYSLYCGGIANIDTIPSNGLVAWYPFNGNANDFSGNNLNANVIGATLTNDRNNEASNAYDFDYVNAIFGLQNDEIFVPYSSLMNVSNITVSVWINPRSYFWSGDSANPNSTIINRYQNTYSTPSGGSWGITFNETSVTGFIVGSNGNSIGSSVVSNNALALNQWHHLVMTYNGTQIKLYVNGNLASTQNYSGLMNIAGNSGISIGESNQANGYWSHTNGKIDDIGIWDRALTEEEIMGL